MTFTVNRKDGSCWGYVSGWHHTFSSHPAHGEYMECFVEQSMFEGEALMSIVSLLPERGSFSTQQGASATKCIVPTKDMQCLMNGMVHNVLSCLWQPLQKGCV